MELEAVAIIPARGGSKRIPRKNIKLFAGKPIIQYSIEAALNSRCFDEVMVSTEDQEIADCAEAAGAKVPFKRSDKNADDNAMLADVLREVLLDYQNNQKHFKYFCCILPTAPLLLPTRLQESFTLLNKTGADSVIPVIRFSYPIQRASLIAEDGTLKMFWPENYNVRSQDLIPAYHDAGQFYWMKTNSLLEQMQLYAKHTIPILLSESEAQDIDTPEDWDLAEFKYQILKRPCISIG